MKRGIAYIGIGSNIGNRIYNCKKAIEWIGSVKEIQILKNSSFYETEPLGYKEQRWFINGALKIKTTFTARNLLEYLLWIERKMERGKHIKGLPRLIDLDLLLYDLEIIYTPELQVPHPRLTERRFALIPLLELESKLWHPLLQRPLEDIFSEIPEEYQQVRKLNFTITQIKSDYTDSP